eukprot:2182262-Amphidinium_carterae.1
MDHVGDTNDQGDIIDVCCSATVWGFEGPQGVRGSHELCLLIGCIFAQAFVQEPGDPNPFGEDFHAAKVLVKNI